MSTVFMFNLLAFEMIATSITRKSSKSVFYPRKKRLEEEVELWGNRGRRISYRELEADRRGISQWMYFCVVLLEEEEELIVLSFTPFSGSIVVFFSQPASQPAPPRTKFAISPSICLCSIFADLWPAYGVNRTTTW